MPCHCRAVGLPVAPDAVRELHEGEGKVKAEEGEQVPGGFIRQDRPANNRQKPPSQSDPESHTRENRLIHTRRPQSHTAQRRYLTLTTDGR